MTIQKLTEEQAKNFTKNLISNLANNNKELRTILAKARFNRAYKALVYDNFKEYLQYCISEANTSMSITYAMRQANAGLVEMKLFGEENIGQISEGALRPLYENVEACNRQRVFDLAIEGLDRTQNPTGKQIIEAAKQLGYYKQQESKIKHRSDEAEKPEVVKKKPETQLKKTKAEWDKSPKGSKTLVNTASNKTGPNSSNVVKIKRPKSEIIMKKLVKRYSLNNLKKIYNFLFADKKVQDECLFLLNDCERLTIICLRSKLRRHIKSEDEALFEYWDEASDKAS